MPTRRVIKGVLGNFLGSYVSRYSDYDGYLLFGFLVRDLSELRVNLLGQTVSNPNTPLGVAVLSAVAKFADQRKKAGLAPAQVRDAWLTVRRMPGMGWCAFNGHSCVGFNVTLSATAIMDDGKEYRRECAVFIAQHDPEVEMRSTRATE